MADNTKNSLSSLTEALREADEKIESLRSGIFDRLNSMPTSIDLEPLRLPRSQGSIFGSSFLQALNAGAGIPGYEQRVPQAIAQNEQARQSYLNRKQRVDALELQAKRKDLFEQNNIDFAQLQSALRLRGELKKMVLENSLAAGTTMSTPEMIKLWNLQADEIQDAADNGTLMVSRAGDPAVQYALGTLGDLDATINAIESRRQQFLEAQEAKERGEVRGAAQAAGTLLGETGDINEDIKQLSQEMTNLSSQLEEVEDEFGPNFIDRLFNIDQKISEEERKKPVPTRLAGYRQFRTLGQLEDHIESVQKLLASKQGQVARAVDLFNRVYEQLGVTPQQSPVPQPENPVQPQEPVVDPNIDLEEAGRKAAGLE